MDYDFVLFNLQKETYRLHLDYIVLDLINCDFAVPPFCEYPRFKMMRSVELCVIA